MSTTITQIARWRLVIGQKYAVDHTSKCPICEYPNRVRLGERNVFVEEHACQHFRRYVFQKERGVVEMSFGSEPGVNRC